MPGEAMKGVVWDHGPVTLPDGTQGQKYVVGLVIITSTPLAAAHRGSDRCVMGQHLDDTPVSDALNAVLQRHRPAYRLGNLTMAVLSVQNMTPDPIGDDEP